MTTQPTKHTPGPWRIREAVYTNAAGKVVARDANDVAVFGNDSADRLAVPLAKVYPASHPRAMRANAALIAAAPDLLAALSDLMRETDEGTQECGREFAARASAAIAKATGVQS